MASETPEPDAAAASRPAHAFLTGGGAVAAEIDGRDWSGYSLGAPEGWPPALRGTLGVILPAQSQIVLFWGPEFIAFYNDAYAPTIGDKHPHALGRPASEHWAELWDDLGPLLRGVLETGEPVVARDRPFRIKRHGFLEDVHFDIAYTAVRGGDGDIEGVLCIVDETTERVAATRQLRESEARFRNVADNAPVMMWVTDSNGYCTYLNRLWYQFTGQTEDEAAGFGWLDATHPDDKPEAERLFMEANAAKAPFRIEYRLRHADGRYRWAIDAAAPRLGEDGTFLGYVGSVIDIDDRKRAERRQQALHDLDDRIRNLDDPDDIAFAAAELLGRTLGVSRAGYGTIDAAAETIEIARDWNAPGIRSLAGTLHFRDYGDYIDQLRRGEMVVFEDAFTDPRTAKHAHALKAINARALVNMPVTEQSGFVALLYLNHDEAREWPAEELAFIREVAERTRIAVARRRAEQDLRALADSLERKVEERTAALLHAEEQLRQSQKMEAVGQLTGGIAHDFNNMLAVVIGGLNLLKRRLARGEDNLERYIDAAMDGAERAASLTQRLLAFSRQQPLAPAPIDPNRLVAGMTELLTRTLGEQVRLEPVLSAGTWRAHVDPVQIENAILNLCVNARDAMPQGGRLTIETANAHVDDDYARQCEMEVGQYVQIAVTDTGSGMPADVIDKAFDPFFTTKGVGKGTGLGLSQVFGFVRQSGGHVRIYSEEGVGTTVKLYLPRYYGEEALQSPQAPVAALDGYASEIVLVVEDEERVRNYSAEALKELGYTVVVASSGPEALRIIAAGQPVTLLFTDVVMPEMTGRQLADQAVKLLPELKILYTTGYTRNAVVHNGVLDPGTNFLPKPFSIEQLAAKLRSVLDK